MKKNLFGSAVALLCFTLFFYSCKKDSSEKLTTVDFQDLTLPEDSIWDGSDGSGGFTSNGLFFTNSYNSDWGSWSGFAYSGKHNITVAGYGNQFSDYVVNEKSSNIFAVVYASPNEELTFDQPIKDLSFKVANSTYTALSMKDGDQFAKKFGGETGNDPDWFKLTVTLSDSSDNTLGIADLLLADYTSDDNSKDYISNTWTKVDLSAFKGIKKLTFSLSSSDTGDWGMNTPAYFCLDDISFKLD